MNRSHRPSYQLEVGWRENVGLPDLGIPSIRAKVDTGARTSALHAEDIHEFSRSGESWVAFSLSEPDSRKDRRCEARLVDVRDIKNTSGTPETRHVIETTLIIGQRGWKIELTLADRTEMKFDLILGRTALREHSVVVNPARSFLTGNPRSKETASRSRLAANPSDNPSS